MSDSKGKGRADQSEQQHQQRPARDPGTIQSRYQQHDPEVSKASPPSASVTSFGRLPSWYTPAHPHSQSYGSHGSQLSVFSDSRIPSHLSPYPLTSPGYDKVSYPDVAAYAGNGEQSMSGTGSAVKPRDGPENARRHANIKDGNSDKSLRSGEEDDVDAKERDKKKGKKRKRVVVACDTCRRKKVKCEGLPNASNTCTNCSNMGYSCTFSVESDRSRGRYEILEGQKECLLSALRSVAPELADQFDKGELSTGNLNGAKLEPLRAHQLTDDYSTGQKRRGSSVEPSAAGRRGSEGGPSNELDEPKRDLGPMIPDLEDGRPRYFGGGSNIAHLHNLDSRPPSPGLGHRQHRMAPSTATEGVRGREVGEQPSNMAARPAPGEEASFSGRLAVLPRPRPQYPSNSVGWVRHVRKKTLVAVGRDEVYGSDGWFQRYQFPEAGLLNELLDLFFQQLNPVLPIIHEHSLRKDLALGRAEKDSAFRGLVFSIIAISSRFFQADDRVLADKTDPGSAGDHWAAASRFHHQVYAASLINVQVLLLTTTFMPSTFGVGTSWTVLGVAIRALQDIGLHTEKAYGEYTLFEQEMRRRAFWAAFVLDGILSINMGRPTALRLPDTDVQFPLAVTEDALTHAEGGGSIEEQPSFDVRPCQAAGFIHLIKLTIIAVDVVNTLYSPRWKHDSSSHTTSNHSSGQQRSPASYKDMTILSKRLDEWEAEMPSHLQSIQSSPYKLQAGIVQLGRHDLRLYILKPFLQDYKPSFSSSVDWNAPGHEESILKKMLLPQCASHARECIRQASSLSQSGQLTHMVFIMQQAFLSAATFMLTVWHGTKDLEALKADGDLIETTLSMLRPEENQYCSALLKRAQRILCSIAQRTLRVMTDKGQRERVQEMIDRHGVSAALNQEAWLFGEQSQAEQGRGKTTAVKETIDKGVGNGTAAAATSEYTNGTEAGWDRWGTRWPASQAEMPVSSTAVSAPQSASKDEYTTPAFHFTSEKMVSDPMEMDGWAPFEDTFTTSLRNDPSEIAHGLDFGTDMAWTHYFSKFLGGLPDPSDSPITSTGLPITPQVHQTP